MGVKDGQWRKPIRRKFIHLKYDIRGEFYRYHRQPKRQMWVLDRDGHELGDKPKPKPTFASFEACESRSITFTFTKKKSSKFWTSLGAAWKVKPTLRVWCKNAR